MKFQQTTRALAVFLLLISQSSFAGTNFKTLVPNLKKIAPNTTTIPSDLTPEAIEVSVLGCFASRQVCQPHFSLQRTGCNNVSGPYSYSDTDYQCYTCVMDREITNRASCLPGFTLSWTTTGYNCSNQCQTSCVDTYQNDLKPNNLRNCLAHCASAPSLSESNVCPEGFTRYNQDRGSYQCVFSDINNSSNPVCASCGYTGYHIEGSSSPEYLCTRRRPEGTDETPTGTGGSTETITKTNPAAPECSSESDCDDHNPCTQDKCSTENLDGTTTPHCTNTYVPSLCPSSETPPSTGKPIKTTGAGGAPSKSSVGSGGTGGK